MPRRHPLIALRAELLSRWDASNTYGIGPTASGDKALTIHFRGRDDTLADPQVVLRLAVESATTDGFKADGSGVQVAASGTIDCTCIAGEDGHPAHTDPNDGGSYVFADTVADALAREVARIAQALHSGIEHPSTGALEYVNVTPGQQRDLTDPEESPARYGYLREVEYEAHDDPG